jgi:uncharacterized damage-inducible protein DinB
MEGRQASQRSRALAERLWTAAAALIAVVEPIDEDRWRHVSSPGVWSIGKDAEHVAEAAVYHQWIVRLTIGQKVSSRRPPIERTQMTTDLSAREAVGLLRQRTEDGARLLLDLTDEQLDLPTKPPRARAQALTETIERVLIGHYDTHRAEIKAKLR